MSIYLQDDSVTVHHGDCLDVLRGMADESVDAVVTDPPAGIAFMSAQWDGDKGGREQWSAWLADVMRECLRVAKPGAHALVWALPRTAHWTACGLEDAGWEIRDRITHLFASGFPKSLDVSRAIDRIRDWTLVERLSTEIRRARAEAGLSLAEVGQAVMRETGGQYGTWYHRGGHMFFETGRSLPSRPEWDHLRRVLPVAAAFVPVYEAAEREVIASTTTNRGDGGWAGMVGSGMFRPGERTLEATAPATDDDRRWTGWGTALKPSAEDWWVVQKPLSPVPWSRELSHCHHAIGALLWLSLSPAKRARLTSPSSRPAQREGTCVSARVAAAMGSSPDASGETDTFSSPATASTLWSIVLSWSAILGAHLDPTTTSTTATASSTTTGLRTLSSLLAPVTSPRTMPPCACLHAGGSPSAASAVSPSSADWASWLRTLTATAPASALEGIALAAASVVADIAASLSADSAGESTAASAATPPTAPNGGTRPAAEDWWVARKPLRGTVAGNVVTYGTGALNIDACRVEYEQGGSLASNPSLRTHINGGNGGHVIAHEENRRVVIPNPAGRWPANAVFTHGDCPPDGKCTPGCPVGELDAQSGVLSSGGSPPGIAQNTGMRGNIFTRTRPTLPADSGGASRYFPTFRYEAKAPTSERPTAVLDGEEVMPETGGRVIAHPT